MESALQRPHDEVAALLRAKYPLADVREGATLRGHLSGTHRHVDLLVHETLESGPIVIAVGTGRPGHRIETGDVDAFISVLRDIRLARGILVGPWGTTPGALERAARDTELDLDVMTGNRFRRWRTSVRVSAPGAGPLALAVPVGWVADTRTRTGAAARLLRRDAVRSRPDPLSGCRVTLTPRRPGTDSIDAVLHDHRPEDGHGAFETIITSVAGRPSALRRGVAPDTRAIEMTGVVQLADTFLIATLVSSPAHEVQDVRRLAYVLDKTRA